MRVFEEKKDRKKKGKAKGEKRPAQDLRRHFINAKK